MRQQAYSTFEIKSVDEDQRIIVGIASTPEVDRGGDEMDPFGAKFSLPMPFKWQHRESVGEVFEANVTKAGIEIKARVVSVPDPGKLKDLVDFAWHSIKLKLARGLSIGWSPIKAARNATGGLKVSEWEWLETSAVDIPMNARSTISMVKAFDAPHLAASGLTEDKHNAGVTASRRVVSTRQGSAMKNPYAEQIASIEAQIQTKRSDRDAIQSKVTAEGRTKDAAERESFDTITAELKSLEEELADLKVLDAANKASAVEVKGTTQAEASASRTAAHSVTVKDTTPPDMEFGRMVLCKAASFLECSKGNFVSPLQIAQKRYPDSQRIHQYLQAKTAVAGGTTTDANYAAALLAQAQVLEDAFLAYLRPKTIVGKFGINGVPSLRRVPFNVKIQSQTSGASASWVGEGKGKPVTKFNTTSTTLLFTKIAAIAVITDELARFSSPGAEGVVRDELVRAVIERMDTDFVDPAKAVSSGVNPASITNGLTAQTSAGTSAANVLTDLQNLINPFILANYDVSDLVLIMPNSLALVLSLMENSLGQPAFAGIGINGGTLRGIPVITSQYAASGASYGNMVIAVSAGNIALADDGSVNVDASREASIEMSDGPGQDATAGTGASMVSMFQTNSIALRAEREINWKKLRSNAVVYMDDVNWGSIGSPV